MLVATQFNIERAVSKAKRKPSKVGEKESPAKADAKKVQPSPATPSQGARETVESIVVAIILALLFRAFVAEAFVIPTGSMAPALMGTHKDTTCVHCQFSYPTGASVELPDRRAQDQSVVGTVCPNCRSENPLNPLNKNDVTFSGDRILVSKFSYSLGKPKRFDVGVFKNPNNAKQNYIKRFIGLPKESLRIANGNIYVKAEGESEFQIARKPNLRKVKAMSHLVYDADFLSKTLVDAGYPARWQPWKRGDKAPAKDSWQVDQPESGLTASLDGKSTTTQWLRYFHNFADANDWNQAKNGMSLASVSPYRSRAISDAYAYNGYITARSRKIASVGVDSPYTLRQFGTSLMRDQNRRNWLDSGHWVGDLMLQAEIELGESDGDASLSLMLVRAGVKYLCEIDLADGKAQLSIVDGSVMHSFTDGTVSKKNVSGQTDIRAGSTHEIRYLNYDDRLQLWVDGSEVEFDGPTTYDSRTYRSQGKDRPYFTVAEPMDAAPLGIGIAGATGKVSHLRIDRDKYYIAAQGEINDYKSIGNMGALPSRVRPILSNPLEWDLTDLWSQRRRVEFTLEADQFFPMGDNSPESLDARAWHQHNFVERDFLVGKAVFVFWPHYWRTPLPITPNFKRMQLIR